MHDSTMYRAEPGGVTAPLEAGIEPAGELSRGPTALISATLTVTAPGDET